MVNDFKKRAAQQRAAIPQVDPESSSAPTPVSLQPIESQPVSPEPAHQEPEKQANTTTPQALPEGHITIVDTKEAPVNRGFFMYPSRHKQIAKDLAYREDRKPWQIIEDALEEYVVKRYGKEYKRK
jgi:hypothetical protein